MWCNSLIKQFSLQILASDKAYSVDIPSDLFELIKRNSAKGLKQVIRQQAPVDPFLHSEINDDD